MRERSITFGIYVLVVFMFVGIACLAVMLVHQMNHRKHNREIHYRDRVIERTLKCSPEVEKIIIEKIIYRDKIVYRDKIIYANRIFPVTKNKRMTYGISLVGASLGSKIGRDYYYGLGFKMQYGEYYGIAEVLDNKSLILSLGYEF